MALTSTTTWFPKEMSVLFGPAFPMYSICITVGGPCVFPWQSMHKNGTSSSEITEFAVVSIRQKPSMDFEWCRQTRERKGGGEVCCCVDKRPAVLVRVSAHSTINRNRPLSAPRWWSEWKRTRTDHLSSQSFPGNLPSVGDVRRRSTF